MLAKVSQSDFYNGLQTVQRGTSTQSTLPILTGIKIEAVKGDTICLHSTDLELSMEVNCPANVKERGAAVVAGKLLVDIFRFLPDGTVEIGLENEGKQLHISSGKSSFKIQTMPVEDFPAFPETKENQQVEIEPAAFHEAIRQTRRAISRDETRPVLTGALMEIEKNNLLVVATDSYRLAYRTSKIKCDKDTKIAILIPHKAVDEIFKLLNGASTVRLSTDNNLLKVETGEGTIFTRLIEGQFPNYDQLIPKESKVKVTAKKEDLVGAINQASLMAQKNTSIKIIIQDDEMLLRAATAGVGEVSASIKVKSNGDSLTEMAFNAQYLVDGIQGAQSDEILMEFNGSVNPGLIKSVGDDAYMYLVMPIRIS